MAAPAFNLSVVSGFQVRRNLAVAPKTDINPPLSHASPSFLQFGHRGRLHRRSESKRVETITAAHPSGTSGIPVHTEITVENKTGGENLTLTGRRFLDGPAPTQNDPEFNKLVSIENGKAGTYEHDADPKTGSSGALEYQIGTAPSHSKWIIAWQNTKNEYNTVYSEIIKGDGITDWNQIELELFKSSNKLNKDEGEFHYEVKIDKEEPGAEFTATIKKKT